MGKRIRAQRKGVSRKYRSPGHRRKGEPEYRKGEWLVTDIIHEIGRPLIELKSLTSNESFLMIAPEGIGVGDIIKVGSGEVEIGNVLPLSEIPEGIPIFNIEGIPGDGGKFIRSSGSFGIILSKGKKCVVKLPSKKTKEFNPECMATIGMVAGGGRIEKPFVKAGTKHIAMRAKGKLHPVTSGVAMNPVDHPFGGKTKPGKPKTVSRHAPPGAKVGSIAARRTGRRKRK
ncbi:MAG: 50S ribosomal protein L2 [Candidatus Aenigmarchaeota archaeon]|nr:50S ribosomal protein L2 [Candidatus Aenigmarchaeota archaeon]